MGALLYFTEVLKAREEELKWVQKQQIWKEALLDECWLKTSKGPIRLRWVDLKKGDEENHRYRSRVVVTQFKKWQTCITRLYGFQLDATVGGTGILMFIVGRKETQQKRRKAQVEVV